MSLKTAVLATNPTSYWPLDDIAGPMHDERGLREGVPSATGVTLAEVPFGPAKMPHFDGRPGNAITIADHERYSHRYSNSLTVACWISPSSLDFRYTQGLGPQYVHFIEKACNYVTEVEWAFRLYNVTNPERGSRLSFYLFNLTNPPKKGAGAYMEYGYSANDCFPVQARRWLFLVGQGENWIDRVEKNHGAIFFKQGVMAKRSPGDKYNNPPEWNVQPQDGSGVIMIGGSVDKTAFCGAIGHVALWNRQLAADEVSGMFEAGQAELLTR